MRIRVDLGLSAYLKDVVEKRLQRFCVQGIVGDLEDPGNDLAFPVPVKHGNAPVGFQPSDLQGHPKTFAQKPDDFLVEFVDVLPKGFQSIGHAASKIKKPTRQKWAGFRFRLAMQKLKIPPARPRFGQVENLHVIFEQRRCHGEKPPFITIAILMISSLKVKQKILDRKSENFLHLENCFLII
jgi:hypothetical protein